MRQPSTIWTKAALVLLVAVFCLNVYRAVTQSITTDEAFTYQRFVSTPSAGLVERFDANNHVLNSLLSKTSVTLFGLKEWTLRLPSVAGGALYLFAVYRLCFLLFGGGAWSFLAAAVLATNPFLMDHLSAARGYGLALAFLLLSVYELVRSAEATPFRSLYAAGICCGLSIAANMTSLFPVTALTVAFIAVTAATGRFQIKRVWDEFVVPMSLVSFLFLVLPLSRLEGNQFYFGASRLIDSIRNLAQLSFEYDPVRTDWVPLIGYSLHFLSGLAPLFLSVLLCGSVLYGITTLVRLHRQSPDESAAEPRRLLLRPDVFHGGSVDRSGPLVFGRAVPAHAHRAVFRADHCAGVILTSVSISAYPASRVFCRRRGHCVPFGVRLPGECLLLCGVALRCGDQTHRRIHPFPYASRETSGRPHQLGFGTEPQLLPASLSAELGAGRPQRPGETRRHYRCVGGKQSVDRANGIARHLQRRPFRHGCRFAKWRRRFARAP